MNIMKPVDFPFMPPDAYSEEGVDRTLIRWMLSLTPEERLLSAQGVTNFVAGVRDAQATARRQGHPGNAGDSSG
jgi:hypothetical protein